MGGPQRHSDVVLVTMPFGPLLQPSLALSLLAAVVPATTVAILYETLQFASIIGPNLYARIGDGQPKTTDLVGEWIFSAAAFPEQTNDSASYVDTLLSMDGSVDGDLRMDRRTAQGPGFADAVVEARSAVDCFLDDSLQRVLDHRPQVVGFTSVFQQQLASLSLARRIKDRDPDVVVVFGGANCEGVMGRTMLRCFPWVDVVVPGEGETAFPVLVDRVRSGRPVTGIPGAWSRRDLTALLASGSCRSTAAPEDLDRLPYPRFDDFFQQLSGLDMSGAGTVRLAFESSRGCWWGERRQCTFCGLNGERMAYRSKSPARALDELRCITSNRPGVPVFAVDNIIDRSYFDEFLPMLAASDVRPRLFYEVKADLNKGELALLKAAGVVDIQPGIESLHDSVLRLMRKGVTAIGNVQLLKWCVELGIHPHWNLLLGFPGESHEAYKEMADLVPSLTHLTPPVEGAPIRLDRFSPNFDRAADFGFENVRPVDAYQHIYPFPPAVLSDLAYFFDFDPLGTSADLGYTAPLVSALETWKESIDSALCFTDDGTSLLVWDLRPCAEALTITLTGLDRVLYLACDASRSRRELVELARREGGVPEEDVDKGLARLLDLRLSMTDGRRYLSLAVPLGEYRPPRSVLARLGAQLVAAIAR